MSAFNNNYAHEPKSTKLKDEEKSPMFNTKTTTATQNSSNI
jgi:hypothetical protein